ncbi:MAG TPA: glycoside hydrolase family 99-like domain-containing protein [Lachnospiraceae bacterium]|nr:glycoside hydrolase family 99-like domain-containing protein [Lachnospiraceae bacterium]
MKIMCMYLPQYHTFEENDKWWGEGYTEWTAVRQAVPLYKGHMQPRIPLDQRYYDLVKQGVETWQWQAFLAKQYGIYGFSIYQYWFLGKQLMGKPMELLLAHPEIDIRYSICWANETWTRTWYGLADQILMKQDYGAEPDWRTHFEYLLPFFKDERYVKEDGKPVFQIYRSFDIPCLQEMLACFHKWAKEAGFPGIYVVSGKTAGLQEQRRQLIDAYYYFEPGYTLKHDFGRFHQSCYNGSVLLRSLFNKVSGKKILERRIPGGWILDRIAGRHYEENEFPGLIPDWDNTPRRSYKGLVYKNTNPAAFEKVLRTLKEKVSGDRADYIFINAWNEWGEGAMLEPDEVKGYGYLEAIRRVAEE